MHLKRHLLAAAAAATLTLAACGGGGGNSGAPGTALTLAELQGFWNGPVTGGTLEGASTARAVVLENGKAWVFLHGADSGEPLVGLATAQLAVSGTTASGSGTRYPVSGAALSTLALSGTPASDAWTVTAATAGQSPATLTLSYDARYEMASTAADVAGAWVFTQSGGEIVGTWTIAADGALSGSRTTGCTYTGQVLPHAAAAAYDVSITESCSGAPAKALTGIAKLNSAKSYLTFGLTTPDGAEGMAFVIGRAPT